MLRSDLAGQAFELEAIEAMSAAFVAACDALHLKISDPAARFVAEKVIEFAQRGIRDPDVLRTMTLKEFGLSDENASVAPSEWGQAQLGMKHRRETWPTKSSYSPTRS